ncbi:MAG: ABC transporter permease [Oscillospiraceae bacterium]|jgi:peptide/nickel transport system permease protein|nr:ABC transporter permease [Oscillospiraceae bacterium]
MVRYVIRRLLLMIPVIIGVTLLIFMLQAFTPGDPAKLALGNDATEEELQQWREERDLNAPILVQYGKYMWGVLHGDFGISYRSPKNITTTIFERWPTTFLVAILSVSISALIGVALGIIAALHRNSWVDSFARFLGMLGVSMPNFWFALLMIMQFALNLKWFPVSGFYGPEYWVLPMATVGILGSAGLLRLTRSAVLDSLSADYIRTARSKGQKEGKIVLHHVLRNALIPIVTSIGGHFAAALGGTIILEQIFAIPGLGQLMVNAIYQRDYPLIRGSVLLVAVTASVVNLLVDLIYAWIDPRVMAAFRNSVKPLRRPAFLKRSAKV